MLAQRAGLYPSLRINIPLALFAASLLFGCNRGVDLDKGSGAAATPDVPKLAAPPVVQDTTPKSAGDSDDRLSGSRVAHPSNLSIPQSPSPFRFEDITKSSGVDFVHLSGMNAEKYFPSANGSGAAIFDYDGDGKMDLYFATGRELPVDASSAPGPSNKLYRNLGGGKFQDVTGTSGLGFRGYCHGIIVGDLDHDGDQDVFLANLGQNVLFRNNGDGTFADVSKAAGIDRPGWSSGGAVIDYDNDGDLDLYVSDYGRWHYPEDHRKCTGEGDGKTLRLYCSPRSVTTVKHHLYRNNGDFTFTDAIDEALGVAGLDGKKVARSDGHGFGVVTADVNGDGKIDLYVANDLNPNFLYINKGDGTFEDVTDSWGAAFDEKGLAQSGMGVDCEDIDGDGRPDLFVTNFQNEYNTVYQNLGNGFMDMTAFFGLAADSIPWVGWGCALGDFDNDGWPDAFVTNGHVDDNRVELGQAGDHAQPPLLHRNEPTGDTRRFKLSTRDVGPYFDTKHVGRGAAFGDLDDDGRLDIVVSHRDGAPAILLNRTPGENRYVRLDLVGGKSNRNSIGAQVELKVKGRTIYRQVKGGVSMLSSHDPRLLIGVGPNEVVESLVVRWPSGAEIRQADLKTNQTLRLEEPKSTP
ncbi:CRTAC1 family protein [Isosphaeraceae bacterium EP7]